MSVIPLQSGGGTALLAILFIGLTIAIPLWVYSDAKKNSPQSEMLWGLVAFFGGILGLLLYLLLGREGHTGVTGDAGVTTVRGASTTRTTTRICRPRRTGTR